MSSPLISLPSFSVSGTMSVRTQSAMAVAIEQRSVAAGVTATRCLLGSTIASSRTRSLPPQPPAHRECRECWARSRSLRSARAGRPTAEATAGAACSAGLSDFSRRLRRRWAFRLGRRRLGRARFRQRYFERMHAAPQPGRAFEQIAEVEGLRGPDPGRLYANEDQRGYGGNHDGHADTHMPTCDVRSPR